MGDVTGISWCDHTWSPWYGCTKVSPGCKLCYAEDGVRSINADWDKPLRWDRAAAKAGVRRRVFPSLCDWLEDRDDLVEPRARFLDLIQQTPNLDWLLLTKRPEYFLIRMYQVLEHLDRQEPKPPGYWNVATWLEAGWAPANVWYGVSVEDQERADQRIPALLETPAALRWVSYEPALGPVDFAQWLEPATVFGPGPDDPGFTVPAVDWIVVGGESDQGGEKARPFDVDWARQTVRAGRAAEVPIFVKQLGSNPRPWTWWDESTTPYVERVVRDKKGGVPAEWPPELRVQDFPKRKEAADAQPA